MPTTERIKSLEAERDRLVQNAQEALLRMDREKQQFAERANLELGRLEGRIAQLKELEEADKAPVPAAESVA